MKLFLLHELQYLNYTQTGQESDIESENPDSQIPRPDLQFPVVDLTNSSFDLRLQQPQTHSNPFPLAAEAEDFKKISSEEKATLATRNKAPVISNGSSTDEIVGFQPSRDKSRVNSIDDQSDDIVANDAIKEFFTDHDVKNQQESGRLFMDSVAQPSSLEEVILRLRLLRDAKIARKKFLHRFNKLHRRKGNRFSQVHLRKL